MVFVMYTCVSFVFEQKTSYERRISDWSSDVCSSDLSMSDPAKYRSRDEVQAVRDKSDPIEHAKRELEGAGVTADEIKKIEQEIRKEVNEAADFAEQRSEGQTSELPSLMRIAYAGSCLKTKNKQYKDNTNKYTC